MSGGDDLVAGGEDRHARPRVDGDFDDAGSGEQRHVLGAERAAARRERGTRGDVLVEPDDVLAGATGRTTSIESAVASGGVLDHHDRVGARRQHSAGRDRDGGAGTDDRRTPTRPS